LREAPGYSPALEVRIVWASDDRLVVSFPKLARVLGQADRVHGVSVEYRQFDAPIDASAGPAFRAMPGDEKRYYQPGSGPVRYDFDRDAVLRRKDVRAELCECDEHF
jgi:hypothetical protein